MMLMDAKDFLFDVIKSEFNDTKIPIEINFREYIIYNTSLKNEIIYSTKFDDFYSNFLKYEKNYQHDYNKVFKFSVFKYKLEN